MYDEDGKRGAVWCDRDVALLVTQTARLRGQSTKEYMRELAVVVREHKIEAARKVVNEEVSK